MTAFTLNANHSGRAQVLANAITFIHALPDDKSWVVKIEKPEYTGKQRRSIFGPAYKSLMEFSGLEGEDDKRELHRYMLCEFFGHTISPLGIRKPNRTTMTNENGERDPISTEVAARFYEFLQR